MLIYVQFKITVADKSEADTAILPALKKALDGLTISDLFVKRIDSEKIDMSQVQIAVDPKGEPV